MIETSALVLLASIATPPPEALELVERSNQALQRGDLEAALESMQRAYDLDPAPELANNLGFLLERLGRYADAADACQRVIGSDAPEPLKAKNRERLVSLAPKIDAASVVLSSAHPAISIHLRELSSDVSGEQLAPPGRATLQVVDRDAATVTLRQLTLKPGRRTVITGDIDRSALGEVRFEDPPHTVIVDGEKIVEPRFLLLLEPGPHRIDTDRSRFEITVTRGGTLEVAAEVVPPAPPPPAPPPTSWWAYVLWGAGAALAIAGGALIGSAYADIARIEDGSPISRVTYDEARALDHRAAIKSPIGIGLLVAGGLSLAAGTTWWLID